MDNLWGDPGSDEVPHPVICQVQWQMMVADLLRIHVAAALSPTFGSNKLRLYTVLTNHELQGIMIKVAREFWERYILGDEVPDDLPSEESIKAIVRIPNSETHIDRKLVLSLLHAQAQAKGVNAEVRDLKKQMHAALYDHETQEFAEAGIVDGFDKPVTFFEHYRKDELEPRKGGFYRALRVPKPKKVEA